METQSETIRAEIFRALVTKTGGVAPVPAPRAFELVCGKNIGPAAMTHRRGAGRLPWPVSVEIVDGRRRLVPLLALVDVLAGPPADAPRPHRGRGRPRKTQPTRLGEGQV